MARMLFEKVGKAIWISHLDLMRLFQRSFKRAGLLLKHTQGYNPRPTVSIALPLSVGMESVCELLDFELEGDLPPMDEIRDRLNHALVDGVRVLSVYHDGKKLKDLAYLSCEISLKFKENFADAANEIAALFSGSEVIVEKKSKNGPIEQNIVPMIRSISVKQEQDSVLIRCVICCQNPSLNPMLIPAAVNKYLPQYSFDVAYCRRIELLSKNETTFR